MNIKTFSLSGNSDYSFFLIHGYTGSVTDFNGLEKYLNKNFNSTVKLILMKGHGTNVEDLKNLHYSDFFNQIELELKKELKKGKKIIIGGISFGGQLALRLASEYKVQGVFTIAPTINLKFPFNIPKIKLLGLFKKHWSKKLTKKERMLREGTFHYSQMPVSGLDLISEANQSLFQKFKQISCPCLTISSVYDPLVNYSSGLIIHKSINSRINTLKLIETPQHNYFFSEDKIKVFNSIKIFCEKIIGEKNKKIAAIIPAFNEGERIANVLKVLTRTKIIDEIIVIDDGSSDNTEKESKKFNITFLKNSRNRGKAYSMARGVKTSKADILFFCDADLKGLTESIINSIITPVLHNEYEMFIGLRANKMQQAVKAFALLSGERALTRNLWDTLPIFYKNKFRIETGLNLYAKYHGNGYSYNLFKNYFQTLKEEKYGFMKGSINRWKMNFDVSIAFLYFQIFEIPRTIKKLRLSIPGLIISSTIFYYSFQFTSQIFLLLFLSSSYYLIKNYYILINSLKLKKLLYTNKV
jgi:esterase/lipase/glycosyltransferase involved in cell wall biosynthesis